MNCAQAKEIDLYSFLSNRGEKLTKDNQKEAWFLSPLRNEKTASFKVSKIKNEWYDHGEGVGGNIIDLIQKLNNNCSISEVLNILNNKIDFTYEKYEAPMNVVEEKFQLLKVKELTNKALLDYLHTRKIDTLLASKYCKEIYYTYKEKRYFSIGIKNQSHGYEMRNAYYKNNIGIKDVSLINNGKDRLLVFEGFIDFLSYITLKPTTYYQNDYLIIHSTSLILYGIKYFNDYKNINLYLDNDNTGNKLTNALLAVQRGEKLTENIFRGDRKKLEEHLLSLQKKNIKITDMRQTFKGFDDLNDYLKKHN